MRVDIRHATKLSEDGRARFDWWGAGHDTGEEGYYIRVNPLAETKDLDAYAWPDPARARTAGRCPARRSQTYGKEYFIVPNLGFALFERAWSLRGFEQLFVDMAEDPGFVEDLLDRITEIQLVLIQRFLELGVDGGYFGDDYGAQKNLLFSPAGWRSLIKPRLARMFAPFRERGLPVILHSDGQIQKILPDLVEIGLTTLNPVQPEVLDQPGCAKTLPASCLFTAASPRRLCCPTDVSGRTGCRAASCAANLAPEGHGLLLAPSHRMMTDIPMQNCRSHAGRLSRTRS